MIRYSEVLVTTQPLVHFRFTGVGHLKGGVAAMMEVRAMAKLWTDEPRQTGVTCFVSLTMSEKGQLRQIQEALVSGDIEALKKVLSSQEFKCSGERIARVLQIQMENQPIAVS